MAKQTTDIEQWGEIGDQAKKARDEMFELFDLLRGDVPKTVWYDDFKKMLDANGALKSILEDRLSEEHPDE